MTRKHFNAIAEDINHRYRCAEPSARWELVTLASDLATTFKKFNPNFDRFKFIEACTEE